VTQERAVVAVYVVGDGGGTGGRLGRATLVEPDTALAHPSLGRALADGPRSLRAGIAWADGVEVIDIVAAHVLPDAPDLVVLELAGESAAPTTGTPVDLITDPLDPGFDPAAFLTPSREQVIAGLRTLLARAPGEPLPDLGPITIDDPIRIVLRALGLRP
jgi:hypothetical protein